MKRSTTITALALATGLVAAPLSVVTTAANAGPRPLSYHQLNKIQQRLISVSISVPSHSTKTAAHTNAVVGGGGANDEDATEADTSAPVTFSPSSYFPTGTDSCSQRLGRNIKVNQNCLNVSDADLQGRGQSQNETSIAIDPSNPQRMVASYNDYRRGDGNCYTAYSTTGGRTWNDSTVPMSFTRGTNFGGTARQYWQAGGDTSVAFDTRGNAYLSCQMFNRGAPTSSNPDLSSAFYVFRSTLNGGASWNFPGRPVAESADLAGTGASDFLDKQLLAVDNHVSSPFRDRVYVTWTTFTATGTAYIYEAYSADYGEHFSAPVLVSSDSALCGNTYGIGTPNGRCNENQYSQPFTGQDGALYVAWSNFNNVVTGSDNRNQILLARSLDGGQTFSAPVKVTDYYDLPDCATYQGGQDAGRACVPEKGDTAYSVFRATNYPVGAVDPRDAHHVVVTVGSYINRHSNESNGCVPAGFSPSTGINRYTGVKTAGACNNDILVSTSTNRGESFDGTTADPRTMPTATNAGHQGTSDQWFQWAAFSNSGALAVSYYDRQYGDDEVNGWSDFSLSTLASGTGDHWVVQRATSGSMPPPTQFSGLFWGDYTGMAAGAKVLPLWSDTRNKDLFLCPGTATGPGNPPSVCTGVEPNGLTANDQDAFTQVMSVR